jgi:hypothetical protein
VPNSLTRRDTAAMVSTLATPNAAASTAADSQRPRLAARLDALASDPVTSPARSLASVMVAPGSRYR